MDAVPTHIFFHANCVNLRTECSSLGKRIPPHTNGSFAGCTSRDTEVPSGGAQLHLILPFPDSRRQKAGAVAVYVKAGQRPPRSGRRALTQTAPRLRSRIQGMVAFSLIRAYLVVAPPKALEPIHVSSPSPAAGLPGIVQRPATPRVT